MNIYPPPTPTQESTIVEVSKDSTIADLQNKVTVLEQRLADCRESANINYKIIDEVKDYIKSVYREDHSYHLDEIANLVGLDLEQEYVIDVTIRGTLRITLPMDQDPDDLIPQIDVDLSIPGQDFYFDHEDIDFDVMEGM